MADRFPIILNTSANQLQEMPAGDSLDISGAAVKANLVDSLSVVGTGVSVAGIVTATSFVGSGANLSGIDISAVKDSGGNVKIQAEASGAIYTGIHTFGSTTSFTNGVFNGTVTSTGAVVNGDSDLNGDIDVEGDLDVDGHTNLDNVSIAGVTTFAGNVNSSGNITISNATPTIYLTDTDNNPDYSININGGHFEVRDVTNNSSRLQILSGGTIRSFGNFIAAKDLDVDGHTNLDNVSVAGVTTTGGLLDINAGGQANTFKVEDLTSGRVVLVGTGGELQDHGGLVYSSGSSTLTLSGNQNITGNLTIDSSGNLSSPNADIDDFISVGSNIHLGNAGIITATSFVGDGSNLTGVTPAIGITTNLSDEFTASAGSPSTINTYAYGGGDIVVEYTVFIKNGGDFQSQKLLAMRDGTTIHSTQFAVMYSSSLLVQLDAVISSGNILLRATPETGVSGSTTYKIKREVM